MQSEGFQSGLCLWKSAAVPAVEAAGGHRDGAGVALLFLWPKLWDKVGTRALWTCGMGFRGRGEEVSALDH